MILKRPEMPLLNVERRRTTFQQVELGYTENMVREEARRCLRCDICRRCGHCVEVCRDKMGIDALSSGYLDFDHPVADRFPAHRRALHPVRRVRGQLSQRRHADVDRGGERVLSLCGTILNRQKLERCQGCGAVMGPPRYLEFQRKRLRDISPVVGSRKLCHACSRRQSAGRHTENTPV